MNNPLPRFWPFLNLAERKQICELLCDSLELRLNRWGGALDAELETLHVASEANSLEARIAKVKAEVGIA